MKTYPIEIDNVGDDTYALLSKGHHDPHVFMSKAREDGYDWPLGMPEHIWMRKVPCRSGYFDFLYIEAKQGQRGAFPCTFVSEAYSYDDRYEAQTAAMQQAGKDGEE